MTPAADARQGRPGTIVLFGPSASGKSDLAVRLAEAWGGTVINADSMQLYRDLRVLTARPDAELERRAPHRLYGVLEATVPGSVGDWLERARDELARTRAAGRIPIVVGGTGLYIRALLDGIAPVPPIPPEVRAAVRDTYQQCGAEALVRRLSKLDPAAARPGAPRDPQRLMRALEVVRATGRPLGAWQADPPYRVAVPEPVVRLALAPDRAVLHVRIERRLQAMVEHGALAEVEALRRLGLERAHPLMKAVGVLELQAHLEGEVNLATALRRAALGTRRYVKRQLTWLRHRMPDFAVVPAFGETVAADLPEAGLACGPDGRSTRPEPPASAGGGG